MFLFFVLILVNDTAATKKINYINCSKKKKVVNLIVVEFSKSFIENKATLVHSFIKTH